MKNRIKKISAILLCLTTCLGLCISAFAQYTAVDKLAGCEITYYLLTGEAGSETETQITTPTQDGTYRVKATVSNYDDSSAVSAVLVAGVFDKTTHALQTIKFDRQTVAAGDEITLKADIAVTGYSSKSLGGYIIRSLSSMVPQGNEPPASPTDITVTKVTNSTVSLSWQPSADDAKAVLYYNVYRYDDANPDGKYVGSTFGNVESFTDVGIEHNTTVSYAVSAVDVPKYEGNKSEKTDPVTTKNLARLYLGAVADKIASGEASLSLSESDYTDIQGENIEATYLILGNDTADGSLEAVSGDYEYISNKQLGLSALKIGPNSSRVLVTIPDGDFLEALKNDPSKELNIIVNRYDYKNSATGNKYDGASGINSPVLIKYASTAGSGLVGSATIDYSGSGQAWETKIMTVPVDGNTNATSNSTNIYKSVFKDRFFKFQSISSNGKGLANTDGKTALFAVANPSTMLYSYVTKVDVADGGYVPYGAVLDFDKQEDTQFVGFLRRDGFNQYAIENVSDSNATVKKAAKLDSADNKTKRICFKLLSDYITESDNNFIIRVTYLDNKIDENNSDGLQVIYKNTSGTNNGENFIRRTGTGEWKTAEFFISDAKFTNAWDTFQLSAPGATGDNAFCVSRVEVIKRFTN